MASLTKISLVITGLLVSLAQATISCTSQSFAVPSWVIQDFTYDSTSLHGSLRVINRANNYTANLSCDKDDCRPLTKTAEDKPFVLRLDSQEGWTRPRVTVNQTWTCNDLRFDPGGRPTVPLK